MDPAYSALIEQLSKPLRCQLHALADCPMCLNDFITRTNSELIQGAEALLARVAAEDARYQPINVDDDNDSNEE